MTTKKGRCKTKQHGIFRSKGKQVLRIFSILSNHENGVSL